MSKREKSPKRSQEIWCSPNRRRRLTQSPTGTASAAALAGCAASASAGGTAVASAGAAAAAAGGAAAAAAAGALVPKGACGGRAR